MKRIITLILGFVLAVGFVSFSQGGEAEQYDWDALHYSWEMAPWLTTVDEFKSIIYDNVTHDVPSERIGKGSSSYGYDVFSYPYFSLRYDGDYTILGKKAVCIQTKFVPDTSTGSYSTDYCGDYKLVEVSIHFDPKAFLGSQYLYNILANDISMDLGSPVTDRSVSGGLTSESSEWRLFDDAPIVSLTALVFSDGDASVSLLYRYIGIITKVC